MSWSLLTGARRHTPATRRSLRSRGLAGVLAMALSGAALVSTALPAGAVPPVRCHPQSVPIAPGTETTLSVDAAGKLKVAGNNELGQLGDGGTLSWSPTPVDVPGLSGIASVSGSMHNLALTQTGNVYAWGQNNHGQVGDGEISTAVYSPEKVDGLGDEDDRITSIAAGGEHTLALMDDGTVWSWGRNDDGQLGNGFTVDSPVPTQVTGLTDVVDISAGAWHSAAVTSDGAVWAWGDNRWGKVGQGYDDGFAHPNPERVKTSASAFLTDVIAVSAGGNHTLALKSDGTVWAWGNNSMSGALGTGDFTDRYYATKVPNFGSVSSISAGFNHSLAHKSDGTAWSWGFGFDGELGLGISGHSAVVTSPNQVQTSSSSFLTSVKVLEGTNNHTVAVRSDGSIYVWGDNFNGQLGLGASFGDQVYAKHMSAFSQAKPDKPTNVEATAGEEVAYVTWDAPESTVTQYVVTPYKNGVAQPPLATGSPETSYAVDSLEEGAVYDFEVQAQNCLGTSPASEKSNRVVPLGVQLHDEGFSLEGQRVNDRHFLKTNVFNGNLKLTASDLAIFGTGLNVGMERAYSSRADASGIFGNRWSTSVGTDVRIEELAAGDSVYLHTGDGAYLGFASTGGGNYDAPAGIDATLTQLADGTYKLQYHFSGEVWEFNADNKLDTRTDRNGNQITFTYDGTTGLLTKLTDTQNRSVDFTYTAGRVTRIDGPLGRAWRYAYDTAGNLTQYTDPEGNDTIYQYDADGNLTAVITPGDPRPTSPISTRRVEFTYDASSRVTTITWPQADGSPTTSFDYQMLETIVTDGNGGETTYRFDEVGRTEKVIDSLGNSVSTDYTSNSNVKRHSIGQAGTTYEYSNVNALTSQSFDTGAHYTLTYGDSAHPHLPTLVEDPQGNETALAYDVPGNLLSATNDLSVENKAELDYNDGPNPPPGTLASVTDARGNATGYGYDSLGNVTSIDPPAPLGDIDPITYDAVSRVATVKDGKGNTVTYEYDDLDRLTKIGYAGGLTYTYEYDGDGNPISMHGPSGTTSMDYDERNLLVSRTTPDGHTITYDHDGMGNLKSITEDGNTTTYSYSAANLLSSVTGPDGAGTLISYDRDYNRTAFRYPNGVSLFSEYDDAKRLAKISAVDNDLNTFMSFEYSYEDPTGEDTALRQSVIDHDGNTTSFEYDELNRLSRASTKAASGATVGDEQYVYDGNSNRIEQTIDNGTATLSTGYLYNAANQLINADGLVAYSYDANGNFSGSSHGERFIYNTADQTVSVRTAEGVPGSYEYVGPGQMERTKVSLEDVPLSTFTHSSLGISSETVGGDATTYFVRDDRGQILAQHGPTGAHYYLTDGLGSTVGVTDQDGQIAATYRYDSFGNLIDSSGTTDLTRFRFAGQYLDHTGLYKMGQRYYDPVIGRWTQQDAVYDPVDPKQWNRYLYAGADPVNYVDTSGFDSEPKGFVRCFSDKFFGVHHPGFERATISPTWPPFQGWEVDLPKVGGHGVQQTITSFFKSLWEGTKKAAVKAASAVVSVGQGIKAAWDCRNA